VKIFAKVQQMQISVSFEPSVAHAPAGFAADVENAAQYYGSLFTNPVTVAVDIGYGEIGPQTAQQPGGNPLAPGAIGESETYLAGNFSYSDLRAALLAASGGLAAADLPGDPPGTFASSAPLMATAEAAALGLGPSHVFGGYIGFGDGGYFNYAPAAVPGAYDFTGVALHEISEVLGRFSGLDLEGSYTPMDLFRYAAPGVRQGGAGGPSYFSLDNGASALGSWNNATTPGNDPAGDLGDWAPNAGPDAFLADTVAGTATVFTPRDLTLMNAIGWQSGSVRVAADGSIIAPAPSAAADLAARSAALLAQSITAFPAGAGQSDLSVYRAPQNQPEIPLGMPSPSSYGA
jgi:hypothetical protein